MLRRLRLTSIACCVFVFIQSLNLLFLLPGLHASVSHHQFIALIGIKSAHTCIFIGYDAVHGRRGRQAFKVFATGFQAYMPPRKAVLVDYVNLDAAGCLGKQYVGPPVVLVGITVFMQNCGYMPHGT